MLRRLSILVTMLAATSTAVFASEIPYSDREAVPDYMAKLRSTSRSDRDKISNVTVLQHNGWTRVETERDSKVWVTYGHFLKHLTLSTGRDGADSGHMTLSRVEPAADIFGITGVRELNETDMVSGEDCRWLEFIRERLTRNLPGAFWRTCITKEGIEVATKILYSVDKPPMSEERLVSIERKPVSASAVLPPANLFDAETWLKPLRSYPDRPPEIVDFEATMTGTDATLKLLRNYPWWYRERRGSNGSVDVIVWNELENQGISYSASPGARRLTARRLPLGAIDQFTEFNASRWIVKLNGQDHVLGESCTWHDLMPGVHDAGLRNCLTADGIPLKESIISGGGNSEQFEATSVTRRSVDLSEMRLDPAYLDPEEWGFGPLQ